MTRRGGSKPFNLSYILATGFGVGSMPFAPGTWGTMLGMALLAPLVWLGLDVRLHLLLILLGFVVGVSVCGRVARRLGIKDPSIIVFDEIVGVWVSLLLVPLSWFWWLLAFGLFRLFDVLKPWPVNKADRNLDGGLGIMLDDLLAGLYALGAVQLIMLAETLFKSLAA